MNLKHKNNNIINPLNDQTPGDHFVGDISKLWFKMCIATFHINPYKIVTIGKNKFTNQHFYVKIKGPIVQIFFMGYSKL
jgi:hypothetical protein